MYIACDIGGTKFRVAKSEDCKTFDEPVIEETPDNPKEGLKMIKETISRLANGEKIDGIVIGIAGILNDQHSMLIKSPNLPEWEHIDFPETFSEFDCPVFIENDADIVGLGEAIDGAGRGYEIVVYITISTGIGSAKIVNGKFEKNRYGFEAGHQIINNETLESWEKVASGTAVEAKFGMHPKEVAQTEHWNKVEDDIAIGLHNTILHWSPDVVVIGGSMRKDLDTARMTEKIEHLMKTHPALPEIKLSELGSTGGINGGFAFLRQKFNI